MGENVSYPEIRVKRLKWSTEVVKEQLYYVQMNENNSLSLLKLALPHLSNQVGRCCSDCIEGYAGLD